MFTIQNIYIWDIFNSFVNLLLYIKSKIIAVDMNSDYCYYVILYESSVNLHWLTL